MSEHWLPGQPRNGALSLTPLLAVLESAAADPDEEVVLRATDWGSSFDVSELRADAASGFPLVRAVNTALDRIEARADRVFMEIGGRCLGPAFAAAAACTPRATSSARLGSSEVRYGIPPILDLTRRLLGRLPTDVALAVLFNGSAVTGDRFELRSAEADTAIIEAFRPRPLASPVPPNVADAHLDLLAARDAPAVDRLESELEVLNSALEHPAAFAYETRLHRELAGDLYRTTTAPPITVLGNGQMGSTIAASAAAAGIDVTIVGRSMEKAERGCATAAAHLEHLARRGPVFVDAQACARHLEAATEIPAHTSGIVEAVLEDAEVKRAAFDRARRSAPEAWLATTSSSIDLAELGPDVGLLHFGYPSEVMAMIEVAYGTETRAEATSLMRDFVAATGHAGIACRPVPGYVVSRILFCYFLEATELCRLGTSPEIVEAAALEAGFMYGPLGIMDTAKNDLILRITTTIMEPALGARFAAPQNLIDLVEAGDTGRGADRGFFVYDAGRPVPNPTAVGPGRGAHPAEIGERLTLAMVAEASRLANECVASPAAIDTLAITGARFPVTDGGPLAFRDRVFGQRAGLWADLAATGSPRLDMSAMAHIKKESAS